MSLANEPGSLKALPLGVVAPQHQGMLVKNGFAGTLAAGTLVYISTASRRAPTSDKTELTAPTVLKADADAAAPANVATWVVVKAIAQDAYGYVRKGLLLSADTSGYGAAGDPVYLSTTAGASTPTENTNAAQTNQRVGHVVGAPSASAGQILYDVTIPVKRLANTAVTLTQVVDGAAVANTTIGAVGARALAAAEFGIPVQVVLEVGDVATGNVDFTGLPYKLYVTNVETTQVGAGNAGNSITVHNGTTGNAITDAMNNASDTGTDQAATLHATHRILVVGATIRVAVVKAGGASSAKIVITALRIA